MTNQTPMQGNAPGLPAYLSQLQADALQLQLILYALNSFATDPRREDLTLSMIEGAMHIARELNIALDGVTIGREFACGAGKGGAA